MTMELAPAPKLYFEAHRAVELETVRDLFRPGMRVLDLGAGLGFLSALMTYWDCEVSAVDIRTPPREQAHFEVATYEGPRLPYAAAEFDLVLASHVLAHVGPLPDLLAEIRRVLKPSGIAVFIVPTVSWRIWTSLVHYPARLRRAKRLLTAAEEPSSPNSLGRRMFATIFPPALGVRGTSLTELHAFRRKRWAAIIAGSGLVVERIAPTRIFYTGNLLFRFLTARQRQLLSAILGSATVVLVARNPS